MAARSAKKGTRKTSRKSSRAGGKLKPAPVRESNGGLLRIGNPGNVGGPGRPPSDIRAQLRGSFVERIDQLERIADGGQGVYPQLRALDVMAKYGLGTTSEVTLDDVRGRLARTLDTIRAVLPAAQAERVISALKPIWS